MSDKFPSQKQDKFTVRFPDGMRDKIAEIAKKNNRSMNSEIILALEKHIESENKTTLMSYSIKQELNFSELENSLQDLVVKFNELMQNKSDYDEVTVLIKSSITEENRTIVMPKP